MCVNTNVNFYKLFFNLVKHSFINSQQTNEALNVIF